MDIYQKKVYERMQRFMPEAAVGLAYELWDQKPFRFVINKARNSKLGDFRKHVSDPVPVVTVNENLNPYNFLVTFVHEVAHHWVYDDYQHHVSPHGKEWKKQFQLLMQPFLKEEIFPPTVLKALQIHMRNPKASSQSDIRLAKALVAEDADSEEGVALNALRIGSLFQLEGRTFKSIESRRTRVRCLEIKSQKHYLVHKLATVIPIREE